MQTEKRIFEMVGAISIVAFSVFQNVPLYTNEAEKKKYSRILKISEKILDSSYVLEFCAHRFQSF